MKTVQAKSARVALVALLALVVVAVVAIPTLATAGDVPETDKVGEVQDKAANPAETQIKAQSEAGAPEGQNAVAMVAANEGGGNGDGNPGGGLGDGNGNENENPGGGPDDNNGGGEVNGYVDSSTREATIPLSSFNFTIDLSKTAWYEGDSAAVQGVDFSGENLVVTVMQDHMQDYGRTLHATVSDSNRENNMVIAINIPGGGGDGGEHHDGDHHEGQGSGNNIGNMKVVAHSLIYTGQPATGNVIVYQSVKDGPTKTLVEGTDFKVEYLDKSGKTLDSAPSAIGEYQVRVTGIGKFEGSQTLPFSIDAANDIGAAGVTAQAKPMNYAYNGQQIVPTIKIELNGATLVQGEDFEIVGYEKSVKSGNDMGNRRESTTDHSAIGEYFALLKGKGAYIGENEARFSIVAADDPAYWTLSFKDAEQANPTVTLTDGKAIPPAVEVKDLLGNVRTEYTLKYFKMTYTTDGRNSSEEVSELTSEGFYSVMATYSGTGEHQGVGIGDLYFYVSKPEHDLTKATVEMPETFPYKNGESLKQELNEQVVLTLNGKKLKIEQDYYRGNDGGGLAGDRYSGTLGIHKITLTGNANYPNHTGETYYGMITLKYGVWNESAPAEDTRVDTATGVKAQGPTISDNSTFEMEKWVSLSASKPAGADLDDEAKKAQDAATASGAQDVQVYDVKLARATTKSMGDSSETSTSTANLTTGLDVSLTFPVDPKYNGGTATITQIHDGVALPPQTVTVTDGSATVSIDSLSQFVVSVTEDKAATKATKGTTAKTGDPLPLAIGGIIVIAVIAAGVLLVSRRRSNS